MFRKFNVLSRNHLQDLLKGRGDWTFCMLQEGFINKSAVEHHLDVDVMGLGRSGLPALSGEHLDLD